MKCKNESIAYTVKNNLCLGCGICVDTCPTNSISIYMHNGEYRPYLNHNSCINHKGCHRCSMVCPGLGGNFGEIANKLFADQKPIVKNHNLVGLYVTSYSGYAKDYETRYHGASGGLLTAFLSFLLDKKYITAAVVSQNDVKRPFLNKIVLLHDSSILSSARSSKYCPVTYETIIKQIKQEEGKVAIVGLPCVIQGFRKYELVDRSFQDKIFGYFGLFCSSTRTFNLTEYTLKHYGINRNKLKYLQYRDEGCLGSMVATDDLKTIKIPYELFFHPLRSFFIPNRCQFCIDHYAELADVSFGDIHYGKYKEDKVGSNSVVIRNGKFEALMNAAMQQGYIYIKPISEEVLVKCQASAPKKKGRVGGVLKFAKTIGKKIPEYDVTLTKYNYGKSIAYYLFAKFQMFVGKRRWLWWIIPLMKKKGHVS